MTQVTALKSLFESNPVETKKNSTFQIHTIDQEKSSSKALPEAHCQLLHMPLAMKRTLAYTSMMIVPSKLMNQKHPENVFLFPVIVLKVKMVQICVPCYLEKRN